MPTTKLLNWPELCHFLFNICSIYLRQVNSTSKRPSFEPLRVSLFVHKLYIMEVGTGTAIHIAENWVIHVWKIHTCVKQFTISKWQLFVREIFCNSAIGLFCPLYRLTNSFSWRVGMASSFNTVLVLVSVFSSFIVTSMSKQSSSKCCPQTVALPKKHNWRISASQSGMKHRWTCCCHGQLCTIYIVQPWNHSYQFGKYIRWQK